MWKRVIGYKTWPFRDCILTNATPVAASGYHTCSAPQVSWWHHHSFFFEAYFRTESGREPFCWVYNSNYKLIRANHSSKIIPPDFISLGQMFPDWYWLPYLKQLWTDKKLEKKFLWRRFDKIMFSDFFFFPLKREINFSLFFLKSTKATELPKMQKKKKKNYGYIMNFHWSKLSSMLIFFFCSEIVWKEL